MAEVSAVRRMQVHYMPEGISLELQLEMDSAGGDGCEVTLRELRDSARRVRDTLVHSVPDVTAVVVSLALDDAPAAAAPPGRDPAPAVSS